MRLQIQAPPRAQGLLPRAADRRLLTANLATVHCLPSAVIALKRGPASKFEGFGRALLQISLLLAGLMLWMALALPSLAAPPPQGGWFYTVQAGDTLAWIALRYGVSMADLVSLNGLADPNLILVGQRLLIPEGEAMQARSRVHVVRAGETLSLIARRYQVPLSALTAANGLADPDLILAGQQLIIPSKIHARLPAPFAEIYLTPNPALQGQTVAIHARMKDKAAKVRGTLLGRSLYLIADPPGSGEEWALVGVPAMTEPGQYELSLAAEGYGAKVRLWLTVLPGDFGTDYIQLSLEASRLLDPALIRAEWAKLNRHWSYVRPERLWQGTFHLPLEKARISSPFGTRRSYNGRPVRSYHEGIDLAAPEGTPVYAPAAGRVVLAEELKVRGKGVLIDHGWGVVSGYFHLSRIEVQVGQKVEPGDLIGRVGSTGLSTGNHLHWEIRVRSVPVDPQQWVRQAIP